MRSRRALRTASAGVAFLALAVGGCSTTDGGPGRAPSPKQEPVTAVTKAHDLRGPAPEVDGAVEGGTITVHLPGDSGPETIDPTAGWARAGNSILQALTSRSLTQYSRDEEGRPVLVPDLAVDLGRPNTDFTEWTFTIRDDATWEDGRPVTAEEVAFGICRSLDSTAFPSGPGTVYSRRFFAGADDYAGPYTGEDPRCEGWDGISVEGQEITITMSTPFPDMDYFGAFMAMGPAPLDRTSRPPRYGRKPLSTGPYKVARFEAGEELRLVRNDQWDPASDPARHQHVDEWVFKFDQDGAQVDDLMLSDSPESRAAIATGLGAERFDEATEKLGERLVQQSTLCVSTLMPDYDKIDDIRVRKALAYAYPYDDVWSAAGEVPQVTRRLASSLLPPGMPGREEFFVDEAQITFDPERSRELLAEAGHADKPYPITMIYYELDPDMRAAQERIKQGFEAGGFSVKDIPVQSSPYNVWLDPDSKVDRRLNLRGFNWCADWPAGSSMLPPLLESGAEYNLADFEETSVDEEMRKISVLPQADQADAWGALDERIMREYFPIIPTAVRNELLVFGEDIGNPSGEVVWGSPNYKDLYVAK